MDAQTQPEGLPAPSGEGTVVLDLGGTRGALVIFTPEQLSGEEIEIRPASGPWDGTHTAVRQRDLRDAVAFAGVFGSLPAGGYQVRIKGGGPDRTVSGTTLDLEVTGGQVTELHWPAA
ncbi:MAG: phospholipase [Acidimicrobiales bacterium]